MCEANNNNINAGSAVQNFAQDNINFFSDEEGNIILNIPVVQNTSQSSQLDELLKTFDLIEVKPYLTRKYIRPTYTHLYTKRTDSVVTKYFGCNNKISVETFVNSKSPSIIG